MYVLSPDRGMSKLILNMLQSKQHNLPKNGIFFKQRLLRKVFQSFEPKSFCSSLATLCFVFFWFLFYFADFVTFAEIFFQSLKAYLTNQYNFFTDITSRLRGKNWPRKIRNFSTDMVFKSRNRSIIFARHCFFG